MNRRELLKSTSSLALFGLAAPLIPTFAWASMTGKVNGVLQGKAQFFSDHDLALLSMVMDVILPRTDSPSASDVNTHLILDHMIAVVSAPEQQSRFRRNFDALKAFLTKQNFILSNSAQKLSILQLLEHNTSEQIEPVVKNAYLDVKRQTIGYYLKTEKVAKQHLNYLPIPGMYKPCINVSDVNNKAWAI